MSNRLTFSLASLIVLIAFGLVFAPVSVMADDDGNNPLHTHPEVTVSSAVYGAAGKIPVSFGDNPDTTDTTETNWAQFTLKFTLNTVASASSTTSTVVDSMTLFDDDGLPIQKGGQAAQISVETTVLDDDNVSGNAIGNSDTFYSIVTLTKGSTAADLEYIGLTIPAGIFTGTRTITPGTVPPKPDRNNGKSNLAKSVEYLQVIVPVVDTTKPTLIITHSPADGTMVGTDNTVTFTFAFSEALGSADDAFTADDVLVTPETGATKGTLAEASDSTANSPKYDLPVVVTDVDGDVTVSVWVAADKVADLWSNNMAAAVSETYTYTADIHKPALTITHSPADDVAAPGGIVTFKFTFTEPLATSGDGMFTAADVTVTNGTAGTLDQVGTSNAYTLPVTITDLKENVKVEVKAAGVKDRAGNELFSTVEAEYEAALGPVLIKPTTIPRGAQVPVGGLIPVGGIETSGTKRKIVTAGEVEFTLAFGEDLAPFDGSSASRLETSDFKVTSHVYDAATDKTVSTPISESDLTLVKSATSETYTLTVDNLDPSELQQEVEVKVEPRQVQDRNGNHLMLPESGDTRTDWTADGIPSTWTGTSYEPWTFKADTITPRVAITSEGTPIAGGGGTAPRGASALGGGGGLSGVPINTKREGPVKEALLFTFKFSEPLAPPFETTAIDRSGPSNVRLGTDSSPMPTSDPLEWTVKVYPVDPAKPTIVLITKGSVADADGNVLETDVSATYIPQGDTAPPGVTITANPDPLMCGPNLVDTSTNNDNLITITVADTDQTITVTGQTPPTITVPASGIPTGEKIEKSEITIKPKGWKIENFDNSTPPGATFNLVPIGDGTEIGVTEVTVEIAADAVKDGVGNGSALTTLTITVGPVVTIPPKSYVTVIRPEHVGLTHLGDPLIVGSLNVRPERLVSQRWDCMPDLTVFFQRGHVPKDKPNRPGIGGGAIVVKKSPEHTGDDIARGSVGISEIMWASDAGLPHGGLPATGLANQDQTQEQWIELHNKNTFAVTVTLFARPANHALTVETDEIDRMSNYQLNNTWDVPGKSGDSAYGKDFIAMQRTSTDYGAADKSGTVAAQWTASTFIYLTRRSTLSGLPVEDLVYDFIGTPGRSNVIDTSLPTVETPISLKPFVFNEVANRGNSHYEWIELRNTSDVEANLRNYNIGIVTGKKDSAGNFVEDSLFNFPNADVKIAAGGLLLVLASDPEDDGEHPVAVGYDVRGGNDQVRGIGLDDAESKIEPANYIVAGKNEMFYTDGLPDNGEFVLILRHNNEVVTDKSETYNKPGSADADKIAKAKLGTHERIVDVAGYHPNLTKSGDPHYTAPYGLWPLKLRKPPFSKNQLKKDMVYHRRDIGRPGVYGENNTDKPSFVTAGYTGVGYKRHAQNTAAHGGTPGYHDIRKNLVSDIAATGTVIISEIMFDRGRGDNLPQWIELYNSSATQAVNLHSEAGWRLNIENLDDGEMPVELVSGTLNFKNSEVQTILPQQTVLVASARARNAGGASLNAGVVFTPTRIFTVYDDARAALGMTRSTDPILSEQAFHIELIDGKGNLSDAAGNLTKSRRRVAAAAAWDWSVVRSAQPKHPFPEGDVRVSVIRRRWEYKDGQPSKMYSAKELMDMGSTAAGWLSAHGPHAEGLKYAPDTWYGDGNDIGTPAITGGRPLPVSLSKFRPERLDNGSIVVRWITESELNNAGFNILRSETKDGEYTKLNTQLIAGQGTTSERNTYEWKDTSAKPNVVYYYQIQDVSLDGQVNTLRVNRLKGHISAAGKLTTTWGELKALQ